MVLSSLVLLAFCKNPVPAFSQTASNGKLVSEKLLCEKPTVVFFLKNGCPCNPDAAKNLNKLAKDLGSTAQVVAFINAGQKEAQLEAKTIKAEFLIIPDPQKEVIKGCGATRSLDFTVVATTEPPRFPKLWNGYSKAMVAEGLDIIVKHGKKLNKWDLAKFPKEPIMGCSL
jgi:peroxiredoxin